MERITTTAGDLGIEMKDGFISRISFSVASDAPEASDPVALKAQTQINEYLAGKRKEFDLPLDPSALSEFQTRMFAALEGTPYGKTTSYGELAAALGHKGSRAVGQALGANPLPLVYPCHRVLAAGGKLGGFGGGETWKKLLLELESPSSKFFF